MIYLGSRNTFLGSSFLTQEDTRNVCCRAVLAAFLSPEFQGEGLRPSHSFPVFSLGLQIFGKGLNGSLALQTIS